MKKKKDASPDGSGPWWQSPTVVAAAIGLIGTLTGAYWQFIYKPVHDKPVVPQVAQPQQVPDPQQLKAAVLTFKTTSKVKRGASTTTIKLAQNGKVFARLENGLGGRCDVKCDVPLTIEQSRFTPADIDAASLTLDPLAVRKGGHDNWRFHLTLRLTFNNGDHFERTFPEEILLNEMQPALLRLKDATKAGE